MIGVASMLNYRPSVNGNNGQAKTGCETGCDALGADEPMPKRRPPAPPPPPSTALARQKSRTKAML